MAVRSQRMSKLPICNDFQRAQCRISRDDLHMHKIDLSSVPRRRQADLSIAIDNRLYLRSRTVWQPLEKRRAIKLGEGSMARWTFRPLEENRCRTDNLHLVTGRRQENAIGPLPQTSSSRAQCTYHVVNIDQAITEHELSMLSQV